jgi:3-deoxy-D-manno-octulosonate 8-phosphate phosphatase KdsC-like HAD superfamily phosphatase
LALDAPTEYRKYRRMTNATLDRLRQGLKQKRFTMTDIERLSGIRVQRIAEMADEDWGKGVMKSLERLELIEEALDKLEGAT